MVTNHAMNSVIQDETIFILIEVDARAAIMLLSRATSRVEYVVKPKSATKKRILVIVIANAIFPNSCTPNMRAINTMTMVVTEILVTVEMVRNRVLRAVGDKLKKLTDCEFR